MAATWYLIYSLLQSIIWIFELVTAWDLTDHQKIAKCSLHLTNAGADMLLSKKLEARIYGCHWPSRGDMLCTTQASSGSPPTSRERRRVSVYVLQCHIALACQMCASRTRRRQMPADVKSMCHADYIYERDIRSVVRAASKMHKRIMSQPDCSNL